MALLPRYVERDWLQVVQVVVNAFAESPFSRCTSPAVCTARRTWVRAKKPDHSNPQSTGHRHHDARRQGYVQMMGVFAEFERAMIRERVNAGIARAKAGGKHCGRPFIDTKLEGRIRDADRQAVWSRQRHGPADRGC